MKRTWDAGEIRKSVFHLSWERAAENYDRVISRVGEKPLQPAGGFDEP